MADADYGLWIAGYPDLRSSWDLPNFCYSTGAWKFYALWQFTNSRGSLDRDVFNGDAKAWRLYAKVYEKRQEMPEKAELLVERELVEIPAPKTDTQKENGEEYYTIQRGDTLSGISLRFHTDIMTLCVWNGIMDPDLIYAGDTIRVK